METLERNQTSINKTDLILNEQDLIDFLQEDKKRLRSIDPVIINGVADIAFNAKFKYYGKLTSFDGITVKEKSQVVAYIQGSQQTECFFDEIIATGNVYQFIGYKLLLNS